MEAYLYATALAPRVAVPAFTARLGPGGHTLLLDGETWGRYRLLGRTRDDAAGEAFDKVAKLIGLPYPGGPPVEALAATGDPSRFRFARPMLRRNHLPGDDDYYDVSFTRLTTPLLHPGRAGSPDDYQHIARGFHDALVETLVEKTARAVEQFGRERVVLGGGVAGNRTLAAAMQVRVRPFGATVYAPSARLATDNAAMIARARLYYFEQGEAAPP